MNLFKKATATVALIALMSGLFSTGAFAYSTSEVEAVNALAEKGYIVNHSSDPEAYNLNQNVLRQEIAAVARGVAGLDKKTTCDNSFTDVSATTPNTWACYTVEALLDADLIAANPQFNPEREITKAESIGMMVKAAFGNEYTFDPSLGTTWQEQVVIFAVSKGIVSNFTNYDTPATRGFVFEAGNNSILASEEVVDEDECDEISQLLGLCGDDLIVDEDDTNTEDEDDTNTEDEDDTNTEDEDDTVVVEGGNVEVTLNPATPASATIPGNVSGLPVAKFDITAGDEDVNVTSLTFKRTGLSTKDTIAALALFNEEGRISRAKNDSQNNDTEAYITIDNGGFVVKAGSTMTITVVADINSATGLGGFTTSGNEFAIQLLSIDSSADEVLGLDNLVSNTMKVGGVDAAGLVISADGGVSPVKVGDTGVEIFRFVVEGADNEDVVLKSITFKGEGGVDESTEISNYSLIHNNNVVATTEYANGKYVTFDLGDGLTIRENKNEKFKVTADIIGGVTETIAFKIDKNLDVSAMGTKYGFGASIDITAVDAADGNVGGTNDLGVIKIDAGEVTLSSIDASSDKVRADKRDVTLGTVELNNISGAPLELQKFAVTATLNTAGYVDDGALTANGTQEGDEPNITTLAEIFENFEIVINGSVYELGLAALTASDNDLYVILPEGKTSIELRADTKEHVTDTEISFAINNIGTTGMYIVETNEEESVDDITPSTLTFKKLSFIDSGASVSKINLADVTVVRGAEDVVINQFEVNADEASLVRIDEIKADLSVDDGGVIDFEDTAANNYVSEVSLYEGSVSESNLLDKVSGSQITTDGEITFDGFDVEIAANQDKTFVITLSIVDGDTAEDAVITVDVDGANISAEDDDYDDVTVSGTSEDSKEVTVIGAGTLVISDDSNNDDNKNAKTILAGESDVVYSVDMVVNNESADVETVAFAFNKDLKTILKSAKLYLNDTLVGTETSTNVNNDVADQVAQVSTVTIGGTYEAGDSFTATVNGTDYTFVADTSNDNTATELAALIDANDDVSAAAVGSVITITADDKGTPFTLAVSKVDNGGDDTETITAATTTNSIGSILTFDDMTELVAEEGESELRLEITTENVGYQAISDSTVTGVQVTKVELSDVEGADSGKAIEDGGDNTLVIEDESTGSNSFAVVPATLLPAVTSQFGSEAKLKMVVTDGDNTTDDNKAVTVTIETLTFSDMGNSDGTTFSEDDYVLYREDDSSVTINADMSVAGVVSFDLSDFANNTVSSEETFIIKARGTSEETYGLKLTKQGVTYTTNAGNTATEITTNLTQELDLGSKSY